MRLRLGLERGWNTGNGVGTLERSLLMSAEPKSDQSYVEMELVVQADPDLPENAHLIAYEPWPGVSMPEDLIGMYYLS